MAALEVAAAWSASGSAAAVSFQRPVLPRAKVPTQRVASPASRLVVRRVRRSAHAEPFQR